jgi:hypothetical protein
VIGQDADLFNELRTYIERGAVKPKPTLCRYVYDDGGQGRINRGGGCVPRAIAIATGRPYREVYEALTAATHKYVRRWPRSLVAGWIRRSRDGRGFDPNYGCYDKIWQPYLESLGWQHTSTKDQKVRLRADELPPGRLVVRVHQHLVAVIDGVIHDTFDSGQKGHRPVRGYYAVRS